MVELVQSSERVNAKVIGSAEENSKRLVELFGSGGKTSRMRSVDQTDRKGVDRGQRPPKIHCRMLVDMQLLEQEVFRLPKKRRRAGQMFPR
jgi:hypothetical protein